MNLSEQIKSMILSGIVEEQHRKIGVEIESFYYQKGDLNRLALDNKNKYPANKEDLKVEEDKDSSALGSIGLKPKIVH